ncbi:restriction endonuclease subunit S [Endozoicomonas gorgoniicola]|uniref:Restriction endonuclease subunit S n=1 Tax=Endozoicomonas gorgoniicola TaxID=1234144 RepID=A0ABT3N429_9GAMM|nr:restriction endonuclease subunit S [Endozoicomonas gorgoniicola]MCW7556374.1 restriction endonuclease subunit S [Endozoicomonas gorgoniicola]
MSWPLVAIKNVAKVVTGKTPSKKVEGYFGGDIPFVTPAELDKDKLVVSANQTLTEEGAAQIKLVPEGAVMVCCIGSLGKIGIAGRELATNQQINTVIFDKEKVDTNYGFYALARLKPQLEALAPSTTVAIINKSNFESLKIPIPPLPEQKRIAAILDKADQLRQKRQQAIGLADEFLRSVFLDMFGDPVTNPKGWEVRRVENLASSDKYSIKAGPFGSALKKEDYVPSGFKIYGQEQVIRDDLSYGDYYIDKDKFKSLENCKIAVDDLLISLVGTFGKISIVPVNFEPGIINPRLMKITPDKNVIVPKFLKYLLQTDGAMAKIQHMSHGGTMGIVNVGKMKDLALPIPPLEKQKEFLEKMNKLILAKKRQKKGICITESLFNSLSQKAFAGKL